MKTDLWKGKRVLVTGHTGFKGTWMSLWLSKVGAVVGGLALPPDTQPSLFEDVRLGDTVASETADVRDLDAVERVFRKFEPEIVFHLAAQSLVRRSYADPLTSYATNVIGTANVLDAVRRVPSAKAVVVVTTDKVYENAELGLAFAEEEPLGGYDPYSSSKACAEIVTASYRRSFLSDIGVNVASARAGNVIGGGDWSEDRLVPDIFRKLVFGKELIIRNPESVRPWQHVLDPLAGYILLGEKLLVGGNEYSGAWNFGPDEADSRNVREVTTALEKVWDDKIDWQLDERENPHEAATLTLDSSKARRMLGWEPRFSFEEAVRVTGEWYREYKAGHDPLQLCLEQIEAYQEKDVGATA